MENILLQTKLLVPPSRRSIIPRPGLITKLNAGLNRKLTLISAPAGFGKTTLLTNWLSQADRSFAWVSLDEDDNDLRQFFTYAAAAIEQVEGVGKSIQTVLQLPGPVSPKSLVAAFINDCLSAQAPFLLSFDDYHVITESAVHEAVTLLIDHLPDQLHLVIASRTEPLLPLARLRAHRQLMELRTEDLRFSTTEIASFFGQVMALDLSAEQISALNGRTEGWIAGLQMAALSMQGLEQEDEISAFVAAFSGSHRHIMDYLTEEVLAHQPADIQAFLLQTSILDRLNAALCAAVTGNENSQEILERLENSNLFLFPLDERRQWYRYHHLFATLLQHRLAQYPNDDHDTLHKRAAAWYERNNSVDMAVKHYQKAGDQENIARLVKRYGASKLQPGQLNHLQRWFDTLLPDQLHSDPWLAILQAWKYYFEHRTGRVATWVEYAQLGLEAEGERTQENERELWGSILGLQSWLAVQHGEIEKAVKLAQDALDILPGTAQVWRGKALIFLGEALAGAGRTTEAIDVYEMSLQYNNEAGNWITISAVTAGIWMTFMLRGHLNEAKSQFDRLITTVNNLGQPLNASSLRMARIAILYEQNDLQAVGAELADLWTITQFDVGIATVRYLYLSAMYETAVNEHEKARQTLIQMEDAVSSWTTPDEQARALGGIMRIYLRLGELTKPLNWLQSIEIDHGKLTFLRIDEYMALADVLRFCDQPQACQEGLDLLEGVHKLCDDAQMFGTKIDVYCLQALLLAALHNESGALQALDHALGCAEPEDYVRTFVDYGKPMASLLKKAIIVDLYPQYTAFLLTQFAQGIEPRKGEKSQRLIVETLSERELEVLAMLATHLTGPEIASRLTISINTLKTHTRHIYGKLGVSGRNSAVIKARKLNLI